METPTYLTVRQFAEKHPAFPEGGIRHRIFHEHSNGLAKSGAIIRNGRKLLIREDRFFAWLEATGEVVRNDQTGWRK